MLSESLFTASQSDTFDISLLMVRLTGVPGAVMAAKRLTLPYRVVSSAKPSRLKIFVQFSMSFMID